jgi:hypothetical protein
MRVTGYILIILGTLMLVFNGINYTKKKEIVDLGPLEINKKENRRIGWPMWAGGIAVAAGIVLVLADRKK